MARVLGVVRLSRDTDASTSVERQHEVIEAWSRQNGHEVVGWAEDKDVSGSIAPELRPELGKWLPTKAADFDLIVVWRLDRLSRRLLHLATLMEWCRKHGKEIVSTSEGFDMSSPMGRVFVQILGALAEGELESIRDRAKSSTAHLMRQGRWRGGFVPYGYRPVRNEAGGGWRLEIDPETGETMRQIIGRVIAGESTNSVVRWLNDLKVPTSLDAQRLRSGKESTGAEWRVGNLIKMFRSHTLLGHSEMTEKGATRVVRGEDGLPLERAEPLITREEWETLQATLSARSTGKTGKRVGGSPLLRVAYCGECGEAMYRNRGRTSMYYRCGMRARSGRNCVNTGINATVLEKAAEGGFLARAGHMEILRRTFVPGTDHASALAAVNRSLTELRDDRAAGLFSGSTGTAEYRAMYLRLEAHREALTALPAQPDEWHEVSTGETYAERWHGLETDEARRHEMQDAGFKVLVYAERVETPSLIKGEATMTGGRVAVQFPPDFMERVRKQAG